MKEERAPVSTGLEQALEEANAIFDRGFKEMEEVEELGRQIWRKSLELLGRKKELRTASIKARAEFTFSKVSPGERAGPETFSHGKGVDLEVTKKYLERDESRVSWYLAEKHYFFSPADIRTILKTKRVVAPGVSETMAEMKGKPDKDELQEILEVMREPVSSSIKLLPPSSR